MPQGEARVRQSEAPGKKPSIFQGKKRDPGVEVDLDVFVGCAPGPFLFLEKSTVCTLVPHFASLVPHPEAPPVSPLVKKKTQKNVKKNRRFVPWCLTLPHFKKKRKSSIMDEAN